MPRKPNFLIVITAGTAGSAHFPIGISSALGCAASCSRVT